MEPVQEYVIFCALHEAFDPPFVPEQVQDQGPLPETTEAVPTEQRFPVGAVTYEPPFAEPQAPLTGSVRH